MKIFHTTIVYVSSKAYTCSNRPEELVFTAHAEAAAARTHFTQTYCTLKSKMKHGKINHNFQFRCQRTSHRVPMQYGQELETNHAVSKNATGHREKPSSPLNYMYSSFQDDLNVYASYYMNSHQLCAISKYALEE